MANDVNDYLMENADEEARLELKTDPENLEKQAIWCGIKPGMRVLMRAVGAEKPPSSFSTWLSPEEKLLE